MPDSATHGGGLMSSPVALAWGLLATIWWRFEVERLVAAGVNPA